MWEVVAGAAIIALGLIMHGIFVEHGLWVLSAALKKEEEDG